MISIIVPVYNVEKYLYKCVESIRNQTYKDIEIILVDDGSTDTSGSICDAIEKEDKRIRVIHKKNGGLSSARNAGIELAQGDYLGFIDSDDYIEPDMYETLYNAIVTNGMDIACCGRIVDIFGQYSNLEFVLEEERLFTKKEAIREVFFLETIDVSACDKLYRKDLFQDLRYPVGKISEDAAIIFEILEKANGVVHVGKPFYHYVFRNSSITKSNYSVRRYDVVGNLMKTKSFVEEKYPDFIKEYNVYSAITISALILDMERDATAKKKYLEHYKEYLKIFKIGVTDALKSPRINMKMKIRLVMIKTHTTKIFFWMKGVYAFFRSQKA